MSRALQLASQVLPRIVAASYRYSNFPTTRGWAEMNRQGSLPEYAGEQGSDIQQFMNVQRRGPEHLAGHRYRHAPAGRNQPLVRANGRRHPDASRAGGEGIGAHTSNEFRTTITDLKILAGLARYHSQRLLGRRRLQPV